MIVDCMTCPVRGQGCHDCAVTVLLGLPGLAGSPSGTSADGPGPLGDPGDLPLDAAENMVVSLFVGAGLVQAAAAAELRARRESVQSWGPMRNVG
jgi:hypothetical protein